MSSQLLLRDADEERLTKLRQDPLIKLFLEGLEEANLDLDLEDWKVIKHAGSK